MSQFDQDITAQLAEIHATELQIHELQRVLQEKKHRLSIMTGYVASTNHPHKKRKRPEEVDDYANLVSKWRHIRNQNIKNVIPNTGYIELTKYLNMFIKPGPTMQKFTTKFHFVDDHNEQIVCQIKSFPQNHQMARLGLRRSTWICKSAYFGFYDLMVKTTIRRTTKFGEYAMIDAQFLNQLAQINTVDFAKVLFDTDDDLNHTKTMSTITIIPQALVSPDTLLSHGILATQHAEIAVSEEKWMCARLRLMFLSRQTKQSSSNLVLWNLRFS
jgi:hypothetical protein